MIVVCPSDETGCGKYRMIWPAQALKTAGKNVTIQKRPRILANHATDPPKILDVMLPKETEAIVFQRPGSYQISEIIPILKNRGIKIIIDMDDDLETIHPANPAHKYYDPEYSPNRNWNWAKKACGLADIVTATTEDLLDKYATKATGFLIPNCIPARFLEFEKKPNDMVTVGWAGWVKTHPNDLQITHGAINEALSKQNARFMAIGDMNIFNKLQVRNRFPHVFHPGVEFDAYPEAVVKLDIGLVPLDDTPFNHGKSWLKALEYAALGVAPVVSPTPDNMRLVEQGGAYVARSPKAWRDCVRTLIVNEEERLDLINRARKIASDWTVEGNSWRWAEAWCNI